MKPRIFLGSSGQHEKLLHALTCGLQDIADVEPEQDLDDALVLLARHNVRRLPMLSQPTPRVSKTGR